MSLGFLEHMVDLIEDITVPRIIINTEQDLEMMKQNEDWNAFLRSIPGYYSAEKFHEIVVYIIQKGLGGVFRASDSNGVTPFHCLLSRLEILPKTLDLLTGRCNIKGERLKLGNQFHSFVDLNAVDVNGNTILHWAIEGKRSLGYLQHLMLLGCDERSADGNLQQRFDVMKQNHDGNTFLHLLHPYYYSAQQYHEIVEFIIKRGFGNLFQMANKSGATPFHLAVYKLEMFPKTLDYLAGRCTSIGEKLPDDRRDPSYINVTAIDKYGNSILHYGVKGSRSLKFMQQLMYISEKTLDCMQQNYLGDTLLHYLPFCYSAVQYHELVDCIIEKGIGALFKVINKKGETPLHRAVYHQELLPKTLDLLLGQWDEDGGYYKNLPYVDIHSVDFQGNSILHSAVAGKRSLRIMQFFVNLGVDWRTRNIQNNGLLHVSASMGLVDHLRYFVQLGCNVNDLNCDGNNALQCVVMDAAKDLLPKVELLVSAGVSKNNVNKLGKTALMIAAAKGITDKRVLDALN